MRRRKNLLNGQSLRNKFVLNVNCKVIFQMLLLFCNYSILTITLPSSFVQMFVADLDKVSHEGESQIHEKVISDSKLCFRNC